MRVQVNVKLKFTARYFYPRCVSDVNSPEWENKNKQKTTAMYLLLTLYMHIYILFNVIVRVLPFFLHSRITLVSRKISHANQVQPLLKS